MINVKETWVVGVSGGPDSMALLDYMRQSGFNVVIAHVNYNKRESSKRDEVIVEKYAENFGLDYEVRYYDGSKGGNFQELARDFRYGLRSGLKSMALRVLYWGIIVMMMWRLFICKKSVRSGLCRVC